MSLDIAIKKQWKGFSLDIELSASKEILGILGASGSGKSMTLKSVAGIETPDSGMISIDDEVLFQSSKKINLHSRRRKIGYLFQNYALFPNMTVEENIACALSDMKNKTDRYKKIASLVAIFQLSGLEKRYPIQLSGGQQQRVALARILAGDPKALLLDEPFSALDANLKERLQLELLDMLKSYDGYTIMVTHSRDEVYRVCKKLLVLEHGRVIAAGDTKEMFKNPKLLSVAEMTGCKNFSKARKLSENKIAALDWGLDFEVSAPVTEDIDYIGIRAHDFYPANGTDHVNSFKIDIHEVFESPFEWNVMFSRENAGPDPDIWWKYNKEKGRNSLPEYLSVSSEDILLLTSNY